MAPPAAGGKKRPHRPAFLVALAGVVGMAGAAAAPRPPATPASPPTYEQRLLPLFRARCGGCHGSTQPRAGFDLSTWGDLMQGGVSGPPVLPGSPEKSRLYQLLA